MQLVLSNNRIIAHGENFLAMGGVVINTETGAKYENATVAECDGCPSDIDTVGYEYHGGIFVPCAPFGTGNNNGYFMEVCETCATPRNSGIPIKGGLKLENLASEVIDEINKNTNITLLWSNASPTSAFDAQTLTLSSSDYNYLIVISYDCTAVILHKTAGTSGQMLKMIDTSSAIDITIVHRTVTLTSTTKITFSQTEYIRIYSGGVDASLSMSGAANCVPYRIYGVKI